MTQFRISCKKSPLLQKAAKDSIGAYDNYMKAQRELDKQYDQFYNDKKVYEKYLNKAVDIAMTQDWAKNWGSRKDIYDWYKYDDGDQGTDSSLELYKRSPEGKKISDAEDKAREAYHNFTKTCKESIRKGLGPEGDEIANPGSNYEWSVASSLGWDVQRMVEGQQKFKSSPAALTGSKKSILGRIKDNFEAMVYPPELRGKSKEDKEAWAKKEANKFADEVNEDKKMADFSKKLNKIDKLLPDEQQNVRKEAREQIDKLVNKKKLTHDEDKMLDGLSDWYMQDCDKRVQKVMEPLEKAFDRAHMSQDDGQVRLHDDPRYKSLYNHVVNSTKKTSDANWEAAHIANKETPYGKKPKTPSGHSSSVKSAEANLKYWENVSKSTMDYVIKNFKPEERDSALAFIIWNLYD